MRSFRYVVVDVFTDIPLAGNQLAVFTDARDLDPLTMQALARETNFSESVFVLPPKPKKGQAVRTTLSNGTATAAIVKSKFACSMLTSATGSV